MTKVKLWHALGRIKKSLGEQGLTRLPLASGGMKYVKGRWFKEFDEHSKEGVWVDVDELRLCMPPRFTTHYIVQEYEPITRKTFVDTLRKGDVVLDVGAHIGYYSLLAARVVGETGKVHAVEPCEETTSFFNKSILANKLTNITVYCCAAGGSYDIREFQITGSSDSHSFYRHPNSATLRTVKVVQKPLDKIIEGPVNIVKLDVEGAEIEVLDGMKEILARNHQLALWAEWFPAGMRSAGRHPSELPERLRNLGFRDIRVIDDSSKTIVRVEEVLDAVIAGSLPTNWYANLWAQRG